MALMTRRSEGRSKSASARSTRAFDGAAVGAVRAAISRRASSIERAPDLGDDERVRIAREGGGEAFEDFVDRRQIAQFQRIGTISIVPRLCREGCNRLH